MTAVGQRTGLEGLPAEVEALLAAAHEQGCLELSAVSSLAEELELDGDAIEQVLATAGERGIELADDCGRDDADLAASATTASPAGMTDAVALFMRDVGRHRLLTAAEEVELAKRIEQGDSAARDRMITA